MDKEVSKQRLVQMKTDDPVQYMFARNLIKISSPTQTFEHLEDIKAQVGIGSAVKLVMHPVAFKNPNTEIMIRLENLEDSFDKGAQTYPIDVQMLGVMLWLQANPGTSV